MLRLVKLVVLRDRVVAQVWRRMVCLRCEGRSLRGVWRLRVWRGLANLGRRLVTVHPRWRREGLLVLQRCGAVRKGVAMQVVKRSGCGLCLVGVRRLRSTIANTRLALMHLHLELLLLRLRECHGRHRSLVRGHPGVASWVVGVPRRSRVALRVAKGQLRSRRHALTRRHALGLARLARRGNLRTIWLRAVGLRRWNRLRKAALTPRRLTILALDGARLARRTQMA